MKNNTKFEQEVTEAQRRIADYETLEKENKKLRDEIMRLKKAILLVRDTSYQVTHDCTICSFIGDLLTKTLGESEGK